MHISKIYIQDNFVPDYTVDPFRRKVFGMEITIQEKEDVGSAISEAEKHIAEYIKANTTATFGGIQERVIEPVDKIQGWIQVIELTTNKTALERFKPQVDRENNEQLTTAYNNKLNSFDNV